ncbi:hypothetical protein CR513_59751, partial [Mucuna pruriens]
MDDIYPQAEFPSKTKTNPIEHVIYITTISGKVLSSFSISYLIKNTRFDKALCDLKANVSLMSISTCKRLDMGDIKPISDFIILEMEEDAQIPIILGRPFLATASMIVDVKN